MATNPTQTLPPPTSAFRGSAEGRRSCALFAWCVLGYNIAVILWGSVVRATGSGAGCGDHWPLCNGVLLQAHPRAATIIELTHRMTSAVTVIAVLALLLWTFRATMRGHLARITAAAAAVLTLNEAVLGALLVLLKLTGDNVSPERGFYLSLHLTNTLLLLAALGLTAHFLSRTAAFERRSMRLVQWKIVLLGLAATLAVGVSGSLAALGDTLYPATSLRMALSSDLALHTNWLLRLRLLHPLSALLAGAFLAWLFLHGLSASARSGERPLAWGLIALLLVQYGLGAADVLLLAPVWMQILHLLGADLLWVALVILSARVCIQPPRTLSN